MNFARSIITNLIMILSRVNRKKSDGEITITSFQFAKRFGRVSVSTNRFDSVTTNVYH